MEKGFGKSFASTAYYAVGILVGGALLRLGWEVGGKIWNLL